MHAGQPTDGSKSSPAAGDALGRAGAVPVAVALLALAACAVPLFIGLGGMDMANDEAIYSYAVQRILETGDWLTPRSIPTDYAFLEKPPLKFWIVAAAMAAGIVPNDDFGMRAVDALFGAAAFAYVLALGWRFAGPICGAVAVLVLFTFAPLVFDHGLRSNNMEAALLLAYCGGAWHFLRWTEASDTGKRRLHAWTTAGWFVLAFMTKFVAALFLPLVCLAAIATGPGGMRRLVATWRDWPAPVLAVLAAIAPWFIYQSQQRGADFWRGIFGQHVYERFTAALDPSHLHPWHFYATELAVHFQEAGSLILVVAGLGVLAWRAARLDMQARLLLMWGVVPLVLISFGTSKLLHYAYPFLPPLALGAGAASTTFLAWAYRLVARLPPILVNRFAAWSARRRWPRVLALTGAAAAVLVGVATMLQAAPLEIDVAGTPLLRNSSAVRPFIVAGLLMLVVGELRTVLRLAAAVPLLILLPLQAYGPNIERATNAVHPLRLTQACVLDQQRAGLAAADGVYLTDPALVSHPPSYYLRHAGPWTTGPDGWLEETQRRLYTTQTPIILSAEQWGQLRTQLHRRGAGRPGRVPGGLGMVRIQADVLLLLPGPYAACEETLQRAGSGS